MVEIRAKTTPVHQQQPSIARVRAICAVDNAQNDQQLAAPFDVLPVDRADHDARARANALRGQRELDVELGE
jgi:hypothetical protein